ncbi:PDR/VanB family oxidoreductase [Pararhodobacter aggregans]|uniref:Oxidoreductase n=1 Tax=Pararhodobacter aggregans TaxID=404875 RepID=A0A2T7UTW7_9RHOB|nr:PDR/VanB family oxidoreductase [Pararhodobacter aggregans]PTX03008.1 vanillate O-demethylase ferredoxin subunit [Pararhodobacter aggregans]PVE48213.1 oxidoreductase [Pararhodobacter aggregans]
MTEAEIPVRVKQMRHEADTVLSVGFETLDGSPLPRAEPGAHVDLILSDDLRRSYSLTQALDGTTPGCTVAVHRDPASRGGSAHVHERLRVGDKLRLSRPKNNFPLDEGAAQSVLIAGGIGITPMLAMVRRLTEAGRPWHLHYAARKRSAAAFLSEIAACVAASGGKGRLTTHFDDEAKGALLDIAGIFAGAAPGTHFYCCGPEPMLAAYETAARGMPKERVHAEYFSAREEAAREGGFDVVLNRSGKVLHVEPGKTILDVLIANRVSVPFACTEGTCGTCETRVIEGRPDHRDTILTDEERAHGDTMMVCCSGSKSARLVLDL